MNYYSREIRRGERFIDNFKVYVCLKKKRMTKGSQTSLAQLIAQIQQGSIHIDFIHSSLTFPEKLFIILERDLHDEFIQWAGNGLCFRIIDEDGFITQVIPQYFKRKNKFILMSFLLHSSVFFFYYRFEVF